MSEACEECLRRAWLLRALAGHLEAVRAEIHEALALADRELIAAVGGRRRRELERRLAGVRGGAMLQEARDAGVRAVCRCAAGYPPALRELSAPPAVLFVAGELSADEPVAIVGTRRASSYGLETARSLARGLAATGIAVLSGLALGIDSAAHEGALAAEGHTIAVLPGPAGDPYPRSRRPLYRRLTGTGGAAISELPPDTPVRRWTFIARNRIIAALSVATVVVEAAERSGALVTAATARALARPVGAVPGRITTQQAAGTNALLAEGAFVVRNAQDVLDAVYGVGMRSAASEHRPTPTAEAREVLGALAGGSDPADALRAANITSGQLLSALAWLELWGYVRREPGGAFAVIP